MTRLRTPSRIASAALALLLAAAIGWPPAGSAAAHEAGVIRLAVLAPRSGALALELKRRNEQLLARTGGKVSLRVYWGGTAGDERDVLRKMRLGQLDASVFSLPVMSDFVRQALVLESPTLCLQYAQLDAVRAELTPELDDEARRNGFEILAWGDFGKLRYFSTQAIRTPRDFRRTRPWLYPASESLRSLYRVLGASGIPLEVTEVYGALETGMIDTYWGTSLLATLLQWHRRTRYVSSPYGFLHGALVITQQAWRRLEPSAQAAIRELVDRDALMLQRGFRIQDEAAHARLIQRGHTELPLENPTEWWRMGRSLRTELVGRSYSQQLLTRAEAIARKHADPELRAMLEQLEHDSEPQLPLTSRHAAFPVEPR